MDTQEYISKNPADTQKIAGQIANQCNTGQVICLYGNLGGGKTTFTKGFAKALGISDNIASPTFVILRQYKFGNINVLYHFDLYRLENEKDVGNLGFTDIMEDKNGIVLIEWAEKAKSLLPQKRIDINFEYINENTRKIRVRSVHGK
jgi:tRNA threonylcarbamoyladenosine biosynthesis protein TsaE